MPVTATSYEALVSAYACNMLAGSASFRTLVGAGSETIAKGRIIEWDGGTEAQAGGRGLAIACDGVAFTFDGNPYAQIVAMTQDADTASAIGWTRRTGTVQIAIILPPTAGDKPPEAMRRLANIIGATRAEIEAQFGTSSTKLGNGSVSTAMQPIPDSTGPHAGETSGILTITWRNA